MGRIAYVNGRYQRHADAAVHIEDRGYQLADAVYEVWSVFGGKLADAEGHFARLARSLGELRIPEPMSRTALTIVLREVLRRNQVREGLIYLQVSRGVAPRDHAFPEGDLSPSVVITAKSLDRAASEAKAAKGIAVITTPENRWGRCDIKTVGLLPNILAKQAAREAGAYEAWLVDDMGLVTEGSSTNAWIVDEHGKLRTRDTQANILKGCTRTTLMTLIEEQGLELDERPFSVEDVKRAREAFFTAAGAFVTPAISIDGTKIGDGKPGPITLKLRQLYLERARREAI